MAHPKIVLGGEVSTRIEHLHASDIAEVSIMRNRKVEHSLHLGPDAVHALVTHADGTFEDLGVSYNLLTNVGRDLWDAAFGYSPAKSGALTASSATSATPSGGGMTTDQYKGWTIWCPVTGLTTAPVYGNVGTNSATVVTVDQWWLVNDTAGTTPAATNGYFIAPTCSPRFMGLTADTNPASAADTTLATEQTGADLKRAIATFAHSGGTNNYTMQHLFTSTSSVTIHKMGLFTALNTTAGGVLVFEAVLNADAVLVNTDTLTVTSTVTTTG
jgi:hypothetical protein